AEEDVFMLRHMLFCMLKTMCVKVVQKGLDLSFDIKSRVPDILFADHLRLRQIITNLVGNAVKFTNYGSITVTVDVLEKLNDHEVMLQFSVKDTGIGIPKDKQELIFDTFAQADGSTTRQYGGTGLGLSISRRLVSLLSGKIWVESEYKRGSTFYFTGKYHVPRVPETYLVNRLVPFRNRRVLVVATTANTRVGHQKINKLRSILYRLRLRHDMVTCPEEAIKKMWCKTLDESVYDTFIVDSLEGLSRLREINDIGFRYVPMVYFITDSTTISIRSSVDLSINSYFTWPLDIVEVVNALQPALEVQAMVPNAHKFSQRPMHILLAEDNVVNQKLALRLMSKCKFKVEVVSNGQLALEAVMEGWRKNIEDYYYNTDVTANDVWKEGSEVEYFTGEVDRDPDMWIKLGKLCLYKLNSDPSPIKKTDSKGTSESPQTASNHASADSGGALSATADASSGLLSTPIGLDKAAQMPGADSAPAKPQTKKPPKPRPKVLDKHMLLYPSSRDQGDDGQQQLKFVGSRYVPRDPDHRFAHVPMPYDVILMDVQMPVKGGFEATCRIRRWEQAEDVGFHTPIIALTAHAMIGDREKCLQSGMDEYITKPLRLEELMQTVRTFEPPGKAYTEAYSRPARMGIPNAAHDNHSLEVGHEGSDALEGLEGEDILRSCTDESLEGDDNDGAKVINPLIKDIDVDLYEIGSKAGTSASTQPRPTSRQRKEMEELWDKSHLRLNRIRRRIEGQYPEDTTDSMTAAFAYTHRSAFNEFTVPTLSSKNTENYFTYPGENDDSSSMASNNDEVSGSESEQCLDDGSVGGGPGDQQSGLESTPALSSHMVRLKLDSGGQPEANRYTRHTGSEEKSLLASFYNKEYHDPMMSIDPTLISNRMFEMSRHSIIDPGLMSYREVIPPTFANRPLSGIGTGNSGAPSPESVHKADPIQQMATSPAIPSGVAQSKGCEAQKPSQCSATLDPESGSMAGRLGVNTSTFSSAGIDPMYLKRFSKASKML
ncbi:histidine kinase osmosensor, partial [Spiromyces aspiralis]